MMQLVIVVLAIALAALLAVGGISYIDLGSVTRTISGSDFRVGKDAILVAVSSYKTTHNGSLPRADTFEADIAKYMPRGEFRIRMPVGAGDFHWVAASLPDHRAAICLENQTKIDSLNSTLIENVISFAKNEAGRSYAGDVHLASACDATITVTEPAKMDRSALSSDKSIAVRFAIE